MDNHSYGWTQNETITQKTVLTVNDLKTIVEEEAIDYIKRIILINSDNKDAIESFMGLIAKEFRLQCTYRKFTILNTNVVRAIQDRILEDDSLRAFYFELYKSVEFVLSMDYKISVTELIEDEIESLGNAPVALFEDKKNDELNIHLQTPGFIKLCSGVRCMHGIKTFLEYNPWYFIFIIVNMCAPNLVENLNILANVGERKNTKE